MSLDILIKNRYDTNELKHLIKITVNHNRIVNLDFSGIEIIDEKNIGKYFQNFHIIWKL